MKDWYWKHFKRKEFACKCCGKGGETVDAWLIWLLEVLRAKYGGRIFVNSGYRCKKRNEEVGGKKDSKHLIGEAADIQIEGVQNYDEVKNWLRAEILTDWGGIGVAKNYIHVDVREEKADWRY